VGTARKIILKLDVKKWCVRSEVVKCVHLPQDTKPASSEKNGNFLV